MIGNIFSFKPTDTLFFRGAEPMIMGESHGSNFNFPPPIHTIEGAVRTLLYFKDKIKYKDFIKIGERKAGFNTFGPMFLVGSEVYIPAPYYWYREKDTTKKRKKTYNRFKESEKNSEKSKIVKSAKLSADINLIKAKDDNIYWAKSENNELESLGGNWINFNDLVNGADNAKIFPTSDFFSIEQRTGIALKENRTVRESHIYTFTHSRLLEDVEILFTVDRDIPLEEKEILMLGAEQRFGLLRRVKSQDFETLEKNMKDNDGKGVYINLSLTQGNEDLNKKVIATGKIIYLGGWDMHKRYHKDMVGYFPAGTVFETKCCSGLMKISN